MSEYQSRQKLVDDFLEKVIVLEMKLLQSNQYQMHTQADKWKKQLENIQRASDRKHLQAAKNAVQPDNPLKDLLWDWRTSFSINTKIQRMLMILVTVMILLGCGFIFVKLMDVKWPSGQPAETATLTLMPTVTIVTTTAIPSETATSTLPPIAPTQPNNIAEVKYNSNCRDAPTAQGDRITGVFTGDIVDLKGRNADSTWLLVFPRNGAPDCWISADLLDVEFPVDSLPGPTATPTPQPTSTPTTESAIPSPEVPYSTWPSGSGRGKQHPQEDLEEFDNIVAYLLNEPNTITVNKGLKDLSSEYSLLIPEEIFESEHTERDYLHWLRTLIGICELDKDIVLTNSGKDVIYQYFEQQDAKYFDPAHQIFLDICGRSWKDIVDAFQIRDGELIVNFPDIAFSPFALTSQDNLVTEADNKFFFRETGSGYGFLLLSELVDLSQVTRASVELCIHDAIPESEFYSFGLFLLHDTEEIIGIGVIHGADGYPSVAFYSGNIEDFPKNILTVNSIADSALEYACNRKVLIEAYIINDIVFWAIDGQILSVPSRLARSENGGILPIDAIGLAVWKASDVLWLDFEVVSFSLETL